MQNLIFVITCFSVRRISMSSELSSKSLEEFDEKRELYADYTDKLGMIISDLLELEEISVHSVEGRDKKRESLEKKIEKTEKAYSCLEDVTDISGIRIITYFSEDVDKIAEIIEREFSIDQNNSVDRRIMESDRFGYLSLHYVVSLSDDRLKLTENRRFRKCKGEIQIRSILQHAWAEIEHDFGYKTELEIPQKIRRRFTRIAGLLEVADSEFDAIRNRLSEYKDEVEHNIVDDPSLVNLDKISLYAYVENSVFYNSLINEIRKSTKTYYDDEIRFIEPFIDYLNIFDIKTISELESNLLKRKDIIVKLYNELYGENNTKETRPTITPISPLGILIFVLIVEAKGNNHAKEFWKMNYKEPMETSSFYTYLISAYNKIT